MDDVLGYAGRRVVVTGASTGIGEATARLLVELGAEVHAIGADRPAVEGLASFTETAPDTGAVDAALHRVGAVLNGVFVCDADAALAAHAVWRAGPLTVAGSAIVALTGDHDERALPAIDVPVGVRVNAVSAGAGVAPEDVAWLLAVAGSPRAAALDRTVLPARPRPGGSRVDTGWL